MQLNQTDHNRWWAKLLRILGISLMGLTAAFTLMSGAGTTCVALAAEKFGPNMAPIAPYQWLYVIFVLVTLAIGVLGVRAVVLLIKGVPAAYRAAITALVLGIVVGGIHMLVSRSLRGKSMPVDAVVYVTILTLIVFLVLRIPRLWQRVNYEKPGAGKSAAGPAAAITLFLCGLLTLTVQHWAGPTHTWDGLNYADAWHTSLTITGWGLVVAGVLLVSVPIALRRSGPKIIQMVKSG